MPAKKYDMESKFGYCSGEFNYCGRINRVYQRVKGVFKGIGWYCPTCDEFTHDKDVKPMFSKEN